MPRVFIRSSSPLRKFPDKSTHCFPVSWYSASLGYSVGVKTTGIILNVPLCSCSEAMFNSLITFGELKDAGDIKRINESEFFIPSTISARHCSVGGMSFLSSQCENPASARILQTAYTLSLSRRE